MILQVRSTGVYSLIIYWLSMHSTIQVNKRLIDYAINFSWSSRIENEFSSECGLVLWMCNVQFRTRYMHDRIFLLTCDIWVRVQSDCQERNHYELLNIHAHTIFSKVPISLPQKRSLKVSILPTLSTHFFHANIIPSIPPRTSGRNNKKRRRTNSPRRPRGNKDQ